MSEYQCSVCKETYLKDVEWEVKAAEEYLLLFPEYKNDAIAIVCENCSIDVIKWYKALSEDVKKKMREEYESENKV